jgi:hypothetical protein
MIHASPTSARRTAWVDQGPLGHPQRGVAVRSPLVELPGLLRGPDLSGGRQEPLGLGHVMHNERGRAAQQPGRLVLIA